VYNEDSNTFTYNDPWIQIDKPNESCCNENENENVCNVEATEAPIAHESASIEPQQLIECDQSHDTGSVSAESPMPVPAMTVEHEPEVSSPRNGLPEEFSLDLAANF
jgi:hypothetical protein